MSFKQIDIKIYTALSDKEVYQRLLIDKNKEANGMLSTQSIIKEVEILYNHYLEKFKEL